MQIIRVFPRRTALTPIDAFAFVGDPPLIGKPEANEVHVSVAFMWDIAEGERLASAWGCYYKTVRIGGPAFNAKPDGFTPGMYLKSGVTFTTRGCNNSCPWCLVPSREGRLSEIVDFAPGYIIQDNNLLQANRDHVRCVFDMLNAQRKAAVFSGGLQSNLVSDWFAESLRGIRVESVFLAADTEPALKPLERAIKRLSFLGRRRIRVYAMIAYDGESLSDAEERLEAIWELGAMPFAQLYQPVACFIHYDADWKRLVHKWSRPAAMVSSHNLPAIRLDMQDELL